MPKVLITGNGFDLNIGLPTSYSDFIKVLRFLEQDKPINFESVYSYTNDYNKIVTMFTPFNLDIENIEKLRVEIEHNQWFRFFKDEFEIETWIDFENKIEYVLENLFAAVSLIKTNILSKSVSINQRLMFNLSHFNNKIVLVEILKQFEIIEFDGSYITLNENFLINKYGYYIDTDLDKITKQLQNQLLQFKIIFNYYFEIFVFPLYDNPRVKVNNAKFFKIDKHYTFNYTPTFEKFYRSGNTTSFLHGKINSKDNQIVLGISEIPTDAEIDRKYFIPFTKYFQKLNNGTDYIFIKQFEKRTNDYYQFFFLGHSLDKSDENYINEIFDFVIKLTSSIKKIIVVYHSEKSRAQLLVNLIYIRGRKNIEDLMRDKILLLVDIESSELNNELERDLTKPSISIR